MSCFDPIPGTTTTTTTTTLPAGNVIRWQDVTGETGYKIQRSNTRSGPWEDLGEVAADVTVYVDTTAIPGTHYCYRIRAISPSGNSKWSKPICFVGEDSPLNAPTELRVQRLTLSSIILTWENNSEIQAGFSLERSPNQSNLDWVEIVATDADILGFEDADLLYGAEYLYRVRAFNTLGEFSRYSNLVFARAPSGILEAPSDLAAVPLTFKSIALSWANHGTGSEASVIKGVTIFRSLDNYIFYPIVSLPAGAAAYTDEKLEHDTTYYYKVQAFCDDVSSAFSNLASATTLSMPAAPNGDPTGLTALSSGTQVRIDLLWTNTTTNGDVWFTIYRSLSEFSGFVPVFNTTIANATHYTDLTILPATQYYYQVAAFNQGGISGVSNTADATTISGPVVPLAPSDLLAPSVGYWFVNLSWVNHAVDADTISIERRILSPDNPYRAIGVIVASETTFTDQTVLPEYSYDYRVYASNSAGNSEPVELTDVITPAPVTPPPPSGLTATAYSLQRIDLAWVNEEEHAPVQFKIYRGDLTGGPYTHIGTTAWDITSFSDNGLTANTTYFYVVTAVNTGGESGYSTEATDTTFPTPDPPLDPSGLEARALPDGYNAIDLCWVDTEPEIGKFFNVYRSETSGSGYSLVTTLVFSNVTTYTDASCSPGTTYYYVVSGSNTNGESGFSNEATAATAALPPFPDGAPSDLTYTTVTTSTVTLEWVNNTTNTDVYFLIQYGLISGTYTNTLATAFNIETFVVTGLAHNVEYFFIVSAANITGQTTPTSEISVTTLF